MSSSSNPKSIALYVGLFAATISTIGVFFITRRWAVSVLNFVIVLSSCFWLFKYFVDRFIFDKIKTIYRNIYQFKTKKDQDLFQAFKNEADPLAAVSNDVLQWVKKNQKEVNDLKELESFRKEFLGNVSHELKTPIQSIQGYIHTLLDGALEDEKVNRLFLTKASNSTQRLIELVNELTSINVLQGNHVPLEIEKFDIKKLTEQVFELVESKAQDQQITLDFKKDVSKQVMVEGDRAKIHQVLINLMVNAIKYGKPGGHVHVGFYDMDKNVLIEVSDDGHGIAEEHLPRLFERFYRTDKGRSRDKGGTGLGLAIVKHIVEAHNQIINVRSSIDVGSTFGFTLKRA